MKQIDRNTNRIDSNEKSIIQTREQLKYVIEVVENIRDNHLHELKANIEKLRDDIFHIRNTMAYWAGGLAVIVIVLDLMTKIIK